MNTEIDLRLLEALSYKHSLAIIFLLHRKEKLNMSEIGQGLGIKTRSSVMNAIDALEAGGLIKTRLELPLTKWAYLTDKGRRIAELVSEILKILVE